MERKRWREREKERRRNGGQSYCITRSVPGNKVPLVFKRTQG